MVKQCFYSKYGYISCYDIPENEAKTVKDLIQITLVSILVTALIFAVSKILGHRNPLNYPLLKFFFYFTMGLIVAMTINNMRIRTKSNLLCSGRHECSMID